MTALMTVLGIVVFAVGLMISIAWHELGHLSTAKLFGIRVPQYMVGFGPTLWSRHRGETEYGIKAIPLGGYIRMIGMFPPGADGRVTARSTSPWRSMIEDARSAAYEELRPGDETRLFYTRKPWKRVIVMFAGPFMNLILAIALFLSVVMGFGINMSTTVIGQVSDCVISQADTTRPQPGQPLPERRPGGAREGGRLPGRRQVPRVRRAAGQGLVAAVLGHPQGRGPGDDRGAAPRPAAHAAPGPHHQRGREDRQRRRTRPTAPCRPASSASARPPTSSRSASAIPSATWADMARQGVGSLVSLPKRIPDLWNAAFDGRPAQGRLADRRGRRGPGRR